MISIVMAFIISMPFVVLIGAVAMPEYLLNGFHLRNVSPRRADRPQRAGGHDLSDFRALFGRRLRILGALC
jgi:hypothetical protein